MSAFEMTSESVDQVFSALAAAQAAFDPITKDRSVTIVTKSGQKYQYAYADLATIISGCRPALGKNGLCVAQIFEPPATLLTILGHSSGQYLSSRIQLAHASDPDPKILGSEITYMRRYAFSALVGISTEEDDDGDRSTSASKTSTRGRTEPTKPQKQVTQPTAPAELSAGPPAEPPAPKQQSGFLWIRFVGRVDELLKELQDLHEGNYRAADADYRKILREYGVQSRSDVDNEDTEKMKAIVLALQGHIERLSLDRDAAQSRQGQTAQDGPTIANRPKPAQELDTAPIASSSPVAADVEPHPEDPHDIDFEATERQPAEQPDRVDLASLPRDALLQEISRLEGLNGASEVNIVRNRKGAGFRGGALHAAPMAHLLVYAEDLVALNSINSI